MAWMYWCSIFRMRGRVSGHRIRAPCSMRWRKARRRRFRSMCWSIGRTPVTGEHVEGSFARRGSAQQSSAASICRSGTADRWASWQRCHEAKRTLRCAVELQVVKLENWQRGDWFDSTGALTWTDLFAQLAQLKSPRRSADGPVQPRMIAQLFGGAEHGCALRADWRGLDSRRGTRGSSSIAGCCRESECMPLSSSPHVRAVRREND